MRAVRFTRLLVLLALVGGLAAIPLVTRAAPTGPATDILGAEPGTEKARIVEEAQRQADRAAEATLGPVRGRPVEMWHPPIVEGILDAIESPFEGRAFVLTNAWQSRLSPDGQVTRVYAGTEGGRSLLIALRQVLQTGERELYREVELPIGVGVPRLVGMSSGVLEVATAAGRGFRFDVDRVDLRPAPVR